MNEQNNFSVNESVYTEMVHDTSALERREGPGALLKEARLQQRQELSEAAQHLHLAEAAIEALENNNFQYFSSLVFVRGHLRSYARYLNLSPDEIIARFNESDMAAAAEVKITSPIKPTVKPAYLHDKVLRAVSYGGILLLILILALWWSHRGRPEQMLLSPEAEQNGNLQKASETPSPAAPQAMTPKEEAAAQQKLNELLPKGQAVSPASPAPANGAAPGNAPTQQNTSSTPPPEAQQKQAAAAQ